MKRRGEQAKSRRAKAADGKPEAGIGEQGSAASPALPANFVFVDAPAEFRDPAALVVRIPRRIRSKEKLLSILADKLRFPGYFGRNWDALEECLRDLSWLPPERSVILVHEDLPFGSGGENRGIYLAILASAAENAASRSLQFVFPSTLCEEVGELTAA